MDWIALRRMTIALADPALGEVPVARLALVALPAVGVRHALALTGYQIAVLVLRSDAVAVAGLASLRSESVGARGTLVALPAHHVWLALAVSSVGVALLAE